ncbi:MAG: tRNA (adenosine(37)-N6)-threonylcarbamoyltransferase complex ATPase subunit type 1 TsaE, partial [Alphaproteobacteria bacterium]|nr:tRNA (adenosine(37)-N6)-threonylcarbamoyltransferase complex ATPase subunit type 1 TsaE [Alphaproteobacteria bacterium]
MKEFICRSLEDTRQAAIYFSQFAETGQCFALHGNLGSGKTTFTGSLIKHLNPT